MTAPRPASTVLLLRDGDGGLEVFMVRRGPQAPFMPGAHVFPGGRVEEADRTAEGRAAWALSLDAAARSFREKLRSEDAAAFLVAGARELLEEAGIRLVDLERVRPWSHWITPAVESRRFDTWFLVAACPPSAAPRLQVEEVGEGEWAPVAGIPRRMRLGELHLPPPTLHNLLDLGAFDHVDAVLRDAETRPLPAIEPAVAQVRDRLAIVLPGDPLHPVAEAVPGPRRMILDPERWWSVARVEGEP
jgi:8-oxo-dGTP pyrophosphatase MutT (NUDIX family)